MSFQLDLDNLFTYHRPFGNQAKRYEEMRAAGKSLAQTIVKLAPSSPEQTLAIRRVQEAVMWANASIACNEHEGDRVEAQVAVSPEAVDEVLAQSNPPQDGYAITMLKELAAATGDDPERTTWPQLLHSVRMLREDAWKYRDLQK